MSFTNLSEVDVLDGLLGAVNNGTWPDPVFVGLMTSAPNDDGTGVVEPSGGSYARVSVSNDGSGWSAASAGAPSEKANAAAITFPTASAPWGTVTHWGLFSLATGGNLLAYATLDTAKTIDTGDTPEFGTGNFKLTLD